MTVENNGKLTANEYNKIIYDWNKTETDYPKDKTIHQLFEEQVKKTPNITAVVFKNIKLTYSELNERVNQLANTIRREYSEQWNEIVKGDTLIGIYIDRSLELIIGMLGILKAGAAYVPFDKADPEERLKFKINDCGCRMVLTSSESMKDILFLAESDTIPLSIDSYWDEISKAPKANPKHINKSTDLAYIIYTSGSTGKPKGVMIEHRNVINLIHAKKKLIGIDPKTRALQFASPAFDASVEEIFPALTLGGTLYIVDDLTRKSSESLSEYIRDNRISKATIPPAYLALMPEEDLPDFRTLVVAGDVCDPRLMDKWSKNRKMINGYGPTENTVCSTLHRFYIGDSNTNIGRPINNTKIYILDNSQHPVPVGVEGEMYIGGESLARGYFNRPELTAERFIENPFAADEEKAAAKNLRLYKTGDLVKWLQEGEIVFIGRNDFQVKIRGFRIELGEVENKLTAFPDIEQCIITVFEEEGDKDLCAYYVMKESKEDTDSSADIEFVSNWENICNSSYKREDTDEINTFDIEGWNCSFSGKPIPSNQMREWVDTTVERISSYMPERIFEIGCGSGLLMYPLVSSCVSYTGIDFSSEVVERLKSAVINSGITNVDFVTARADQIDLLETVNNGETDTVIINSVIQYFPNVEYLESVIKNSLDIVKTGRIIIGDIKDYRLIEEFHLTLTEHSMEKMGITPNDDALKRKHLYSIEHEKEFLVSPEYFIELSRKTPEISAIEILPRRGRSLHEMNCYRYDVILHKNNNSVKTSKIKLNWIESKDITEQFKENLEVIAVSDYPNIRITDICKSLNLLNENKNSQSAEIPDKATVKYLGIEDLFELAKSNNYNLYIALSESKTAYDLVFYKNSISIDTLIFSLSERFVNSFINTKNPICNVPAITQKRKHLSQTELHNYLSGYLPDYMIPSYFIKLDKMPLNTSGKIDRNALPNPKSSNIFSGNYVAPRNETEKLLADIWCNILKLDKVSINDSFFHIGGNSLKVIQLALKITSKTGKKFFARDIFVNDTVLKQSLHFDNIKGDSFDGVVKIEKNDSYSILNAQSRIYLINKIYPDNTAYNVPLFYKTFKELDSEKLKKGLFKIAEKQESLRTYFIETETEIRQKIIESDVFDFKIDERIIEKKDIDSALRNFVQPFDFNKAPLWRVGIFKIENVNETYLLFDFHHIIFDGLSVGLFFKYLKDSYEGIELEEPTAQSKDYAQFEIELKDTEDYKKQAEFWNGEFNNEIPLLDLPYDKTRPKEKDYLGNAVIVEFDKNIRQDLETLEQETGATKFMIMLAAFNILLSKYTGQNDIVVGVPTFGRKHEDILSTIGMFVGTLPIRSIIPEEVRAIEYLNILKQKVIEAVNNQDYPFDELVSSLKVERDSGRNPLFDVMFALWEGTDDAFTLEQTELMKIHENIQTEKFDLTAYVFENEEKSEIIFNYATSLFKKETIERLSTHYINILSAIVSNPRIELSKINLLSSAEHSQIIYDWNKTETDYPKDKTVHELFEAQVKKTPHNTALVFENNKISYAVLNKKANKFANYLRQIFEENFKEKIKKDELIGVCIDRGFDMIEAILGILKAGAAYVPFEISDSEERMKFKIEDCGCRMIISDSSQKNKFSSYDLKKIQFIYIDDLGNKLKDAQECNPACINSASDYAYAIYTSGSTGRPKGVVLEHKTITNLVDFGINRTNIPLNGNILQFANITFDVSVQEIFSTLLAGGTLFLIRKELKENIELFLEYLKENDIEVLFCPPALLNLIFITPELNKKFPVNIKHIIVAGEQLNVCPELKKFIRNNKTYLHNHYGPSETHVVTALTINPDDPDIADAPSIGKPIQNSKAYILDKNMMFVPIGVSGELYISGETLARGYLNRRKLTSERFIDNPFVTDIEKTAKRNLKLYKTGDIVKWLPEGNIAFIGRNDFQVKIRGFRVELGEVENRLLEHIKINQCAVTVFERNNNKYICAYYVLANKQQPATGDQQFREYLSDIFPDYMVPSFFIELEKMPVNSSGKINRKELPAPDSSHTAADGYIAPNTKTEKKLAEIWCSVLKIDKVGIHDNFFHIGGHSLNATQVISRIHRIFDSECTVRNLFECKSIQKLAAFIDCRKTKIKSSEVTFNRVDRNKPVSLSPAQERLWFLDRYQNGKSSNYNIPLAFMIKGKPEIKSLEKAFNIIIGRHESLRTLFKQTENGEPYQNILPAGLQNEIRLHTENIEKNMVSSILTKEANYCFNLANEQLIKVRLFKIKETDNYILSINQHHIISDGWSLGIMFNELSEIYSTLIEGKNIEITDPEYQYADIVEWQKKHLQSNAVKEQLEYWKNKLTGAKQLNFPTDKPRPSVMSHKGSYSKLKLNADLTGELKTFSEKTGLTLFMTLLSGFYILLSRYTEQNDIIVGTPIANRHYSQFEKIMGFFVNTIALRVNTEKLSVIELSELVKDTCFEAYNSQDVPFEKIIGELDIERDQSRNPLFQILFTLQNAADLNTMNLSGLEVKPIDIEYKVSKFDMSMMLTETENHLTGILEYNTDLYDKSTIEQIICHYRILLSEMVKHPERKISELKIIDDSEYQKLLYMWNKTETDYPKDKTIQQIFEIQVSLTPNKTAVLFEDKELTYRELNEKANQLAHTIREMYKAIWKVDVQGDTLIGIYIERGTDMIIGILGILKAGAAYVPFDPADPEERLGFKINDCGCKMIITSTSYTRNLTFLTETDTIPLSIDSYWDEISKAPKTNPEHINKSTDLAYIIYTSGSTGKPKGVMIEYKTFVNMAYAQKKLYKIEDFNNVLLFASLSFDASVLEIFTALISGSTLHVASDEVRKNPELLFELIEKNNIAVATLPPAFIKIMPEKELHMLKVLITAGDVCEPETMDTWCSNRIFINAYGPTENTVCSTLHYYNKGDSNTNIGNPVDNVKTYILNSKLLPAAIGVYGELYIGGENLARGYFNRPKLTAERFIENPFVTDEEKTAGKNLKLYKTGDLARWLPNGDIEFAGRNDFQVKIRGFRIELGEIETKLSEHPLVKQCIITLYEKKSDKYLCAYYTLKKSESSKEKLKDEFISFLSKLLPDYMIPSFFIKLDKLPLNTSGKIDRKLLPMPDSNTILSGEYIAPRTEEEKRISEIWCEVLGLEKVGMKDNFFSVGGNSINAVKLATQMEKVFLRQIPIVTLFQKNTIEKQAKEITHLILAPAKDFVYLKNNKSYTGTLILFPAGFSGAEVYYKLIGKLNPDIRIIGLNNYFLNNPDSESDDVSTILNGYLNLLKKEGIFNNDKPIYLGGMSSGGNMVLSILSLMKDIDIKNVFLFDSILFEKDVIDIPENSHEERMTDPDNNFLVGFRAAGISQERILPLIRRVENFSHSLTYNKHSAKTVLFKAGLDTVGVILSDEYNGWRKYLKNIEKIDIPTVNHFNIMSKTESLNIVAKTINRYLSTK